MMPNGSSEIGLPNFGDGARYGRGTVSGAGMGRCFPIVAGFPGAVSGWMPSSGPVWRRGGVWGIRCKLVLLKEEITAPVLAARGFFSGAVFGRCKLEQ